MWDTAGPLRFATLFLGLLDPATGRLSYVNAGHLPPLILRAAGGQEPVPATGPPAGLLEDVDYGVGEVTLAPGDLLVVYSDGIPEAWNADDEDYGTARLEELLRRERLQPAPRIADCLAADMDAFLGGLPPPDDVTLLLLRRC